MDGSVTTASAQGLREAQEDRFVALRLDDGWLLAVFDGHGGAGTSELAAKLLPDAFRHALDRHHDAKAAIEAAIGVLRTECADRRDGSSASVVYVDESKGRATAGVLGDSPVIVRDVSGRCVLGPLHNTIANPDDAARAVERGAVLMGPYLTDPDSYEGVNLTRTIGDAAFPFLGRTPETIAVDLGPDSFVVVASDGVFTMATWRPDDLVQRVELLVRQGADARMLVDGALESGSDDNVTVVLWRP